MTSEELRRLYPGCAGKSAYPNKKEAKRKAEGLARRISGDKVSVYRCRYCEMFHVGTMTRESHRKFIRTAHSRAEWLRKNQE